MIRITSIDPDPRASFPLTNAGRGGHPEPFVVPLLVGRAVGLPPGVDALLVASDLQAMDLDGPAPRLAGVGVAEALRGLAEVGELPPAERTAVVLAGDLWSDPACERRGGLGDVSPVWLAFADAFRWVAGVAGNHDAIRARLPGNAHLLDDRVALLDGLAIAGLGGIGGNPRKPNRRAPEDQAARIVELLDRGADLLVLHEGPALDGRRGSEDVRAALEAARGAAPVVCGHCHWDEPLAEHEGRQVLNVDGRVVALLASG